MGLPRSANGRSGPTKQLSLPPDALTTDPGAYNGDE
jgi:hypothetical protein